MQRQLLCAVLALGTASAAIDVLVKPNAAVAAPAAQAVTGDAKADQALARQYPDARLTKKAERDGGNGIKIFEVEVSPKSGGSSTAVVTSNGDFLDSGVPASAKALPGPVREATEGLFKTAPSDVDSRVSTTYFVYIAANNKQYQLTLDATGRLTDIKSQKELREEQAASTREEITGDQHQKVAEEAHQRMPDATIGKTYKWPEAEGFVVVDTDEKGKKGWIILDSANDVYAIRTDIDKGQLPQPVMATVNGLFKGDRVQGAQRGEQRYYQVRESAGGHPLTLKIRPNGDIFDVQSGK